MTRSPVLATFALVALAAVFVAGCGGGSDGEGTATPAPPTAAASPTAVRTPVGDIRTLDLESNRDVVDLIDETGGAYVQTDVIYADLTGDGAEEAVVPLSSGGTQGVLAYVVLAPTADDAEALLSKTAEDAPGLAVDVIEGKLVETKPQPGPDDPECCPSMLRKTTYVWDGAKLAIESIKTEPNPDAGVKPTPEQ